MRVPTVLHSQYLVLSGHYFFNGDDHVSSFAVKLLKKFIIIFYEVPRQFYVETSLTIFIVLQQVSKPNNMCISLIF